MSDAIVGSGSVIGFDLNNDERHRGTRDLLHMGFRADATRDVLEAVRNEGRDIARGQADLNQQIERVNAATNLNVEKTAAATSLAIEKTAAAGILEATKNAAAAQLEAAKNAAAAALQAEKCCCEIKQLVQAEHCTTRALINDVEARHVRDQLADAKQELLVSRLSGNGNGNN